VRTNRQVIDLSLQLATTAGLTVWCSLVIQPFFPIIVWGGDSRHRLAPDLHRWLWKLLGHRANLAASLMAFGAPLSPWGLSCI